MTSASSERSQSPARRMAEATTPGPLTPTLTAVSGSPTPQKAPAMNGLSSGTLANTTSLAQPIDCSSRVRYAARLMTLPMRATASMLMPALVLATLTDEQMLRVSASASGMTEMRRSAPTVMPFCTNAEKPPRKLTPTASAARWRACAILR